MMATLGPGLGFAQTATTNDPRPLVSIEVRMVLMPRETAAELFEPEVTLGRVGVIKQETLRKLQQLVAKKKATILCQPQVTTVSQNTAQIKTVKEIRYPTEFSPASQMAGTNVATNAGADGGTICFPGGFETREVGTLLNVTPTVMSDGTRIQLTLVPELAEQLANSKFEVSPRGKRFVEQPRFRSRQITTTVVMKSGTTILLGVADPVEGEEDKNQVTLIFLTSTIVSLE